MGGKKDKKKKAKDPLKKAAQAARKEAKADKASLKRIQKEQNRLNSLNIHDDDHSDDDDNKGGTKKKGTADDIDSILNEYRNRSKELETSELETLDTPFPLPPRGNFTWTLCPTNGMFYMFGGEYYDGAENLVFDEMLRWDPDYKQSTDDEEDDGENSNSNSNTGQWTRISTPPPHPPQRCAHSAIFHNDAIYIFGGECATADKYHHYKDLWKFNIKSNTWEECKPRGGSPHARSGHRAVLWRHYMILFGGFHEALRSETKWFNDVWIYDFQTSIWTELKYGKLSRVPPPRSACNMALCTSPTESLVVYGGYSKVKNLNAPNASKSEGIIHIDCWMLPLKALANASKGGGPLNGANPPSWERISRKGEYPSARAATSSIVHKNKMLLFGGVLDNEGDHHKLDSVFYDDLFAFDMERRRWFAMRLKKASGGGRRRRKKKEEGNDVTDEVIQAKENDEEVSDIDSEEEAILLAGKDEEAKSSGYDLGQLRHDMFAFIDKDGNVVYEKIEEEEGANTEMTKKEEEEEVTPATTKSLDRSENTDTSSTIEKPSASESSPTKQEELPTAKSTEKIAASSVMKVDEKGLPTAVIRQIPLPRINAQTVIRNNTLYIYGGVLEVGDREVTLDDCWSIDLNKREKWSCIWAGQMHRQVWKGIDSDNESYISTSDQGADDLDDDDDDDSDDGMAAEIEPILETESASDDDSEARKKARKAAKKAKEKAARKGIKHEIAELKEKLGVDNEMRTPLMGEALADFYSRTSDYWNDEAAKEIAASAEGEALSRKELKREGFQLAQKRFEELKPILDRLNELETEKAENDDKKKEKKKDKADRKKNRLK